jgi:hypothetical protein
MTGGFAMNVLTMAEGMERVSTEKKSLADLIADARKIQGECEDWRVSNVSSLTVHFNGGTGEIAFRPDGEGEMQGGNGRVVRRGLRRFALGQFCSKLGIPAKYIEKCMDEGFSDLAEQNVNAFLDVYGKNLFIRTYQDRIRGVLSDRFSAFDAPDVLGCVGDVLPRSGYDIKGTVLNDERLHLRLVRENPMGILNQDLFGGIQIDSSDVGRSVLNVGFFVYRQVCTNGMIVVQGGESLFRQRHVGIAPSEFREGLAAAIAQIQSMEQKSGEIIAAAQKARVDLRAVETAEDLRRAFNLAENGVAEALKIAGERYGANRLGVSDAVTEIAQGYSLERRLELERMAGAYLRAA